MRIRTYLQSLVITLALLIASNTAAEDTAMLELANARGCFICHSIVTDPWKEGLPLAPSYQKVALRYKGDTKAFDRLLDRVLHGTSYREQAWEGKVAMRFMPPNVNVSRWEGAALVNWILALKISPEDAERLTHHDNMMALSTYNGCAICHRVDPINERRVVPLAPSYREIALHYKGKSHAQQRLVDAVLEGTLGDGVKTWENVNMRFMPPSVNVKPKDAERLVSWILGLDTKGVRLPPKPPQRTTAKDKSSEVKE